MTANGSYRPYRLPSFDYEEDPTRPPPPPPASEKPSRMPRYQSEEAVSPVSASPASSPFGDHVYPVQALHMGDPHHGYGEDNAYPQDTRSPSFADDVPLHQYPGKSGYSTSAKASPRGYQSGDEHGGSPTPDYELGPKARAINRIAGIFHRTGRTPWFVYIMTLIQVTVFVAELANNSSITGSPIAIHPSFNPMIGPSNRVLIVMGARYVPCMRSTHGVQDSTIPPNWPCPNTTTTDESSPDMHCTLSDVCGFGGVPNPVGGGTLEDQPQPNQWFRFIIPMFLHAGIIHISFNMLLQLTLGRDMEKMIGPLRFAIVYFSSGVFGFVLGGNYAASGQSSSGASGCLFGIIALTLLDLLYTWRERKSPFIDLTFVVVDIAVCFVLGLLPGLDNFSHIGGFLMGLGLGIFLLHSPKAIRRRTDEDPIFPEPSSTPPGNGRAFETSNAGFKDFMQSPKEFCRDRKPLWWAWWGMRVAALIVVLVAFIVLLNNFYKYRDACSWCKYLSCLPVNNWCQLDDLQIITPT
ncbi:MAG: hypothetical protein M1838_004656 [Thelocarpon superellum]|nr:MAG: hypothetical protein M1838_004656 [Thelocarpon superellum]